MKIWTPPTGCVVSPFPDDQPHGVRTANGLVWAASREGFYHVYGTQDHCWSQSMIEEYTQEGSSSGVGIPSVVEPWKVLKRSPPDSDWVIESPLPGERMVSSGDLTYQSQEVAQDPVKTSDNSNGDDCASLPESVATSYAIDLQTPLPVGNISQFKTHVHGDQLERAGDKTQTPDEPPCLGHCDGDDSTVREEEFVQKLLLHEPKGTCTSIGRTRSENPPKLQEFLPADCFPDVLIVNDPCAHTSDLSLYPRPRIVTYQRVLPRKTMPPAKTSTVLSNQIQPTASLFGYLNLNVPTLGCGSHAQAYSATLHLPGPLSETGPVKVAAKLSKLIRKDLDMHVTEGIVYNGCPRHLQEDWAGFNYIEKLESARVGCDGRGVFPACAVVPKFYGYYVPILDETEELDLSVLEKRGSFIESCIRERLSPILLVEDCGSPIDVPFISSTDRTTLLSFPLRLHQAGVYQGSFHHRNVLVQPGPLHLPPWERSMRTPSYRLIDYGRARLEDTWTTMPNHEYFFNWDMFEKQAWEEARYMFKPRYSYY